MPKHRLLESEAQQLLGIAEELSRKNPGQLPEWLVFYADCDFSGVLTQTRFFLDLQAQRLRLINGTKGGDDDSAEVDTQD